MSKESLAIVANQLVSPGKGILAADESTKSIAKKLSAAGIENTVENHRLYRQLFFTTPDMEQYISGVIMYDETIRQTTDNGVPFAKLLSDKGVIPGIKVDLGVKELEGSPEEKLTFGLDGLDRRLKEYYGLGARFAKWRAVIKIGHNIPTENCIQLNMEALAKYAKICQENDIVPIVEPEVLMDGDHSIEQCYEVTKKTLSVLFDELKKLEVDLSGLLLKPNMVIYSLNGEKVMSQIVGRETVKCFKEVVPAEVDGIVFLSGGQTEAEACQNLDAVVRIGQGAPWKFSFSFGRALQNTALQVWSGKAENVAEAQKAFLRRASLASKASLGEYNSELELA
ncbi:MAG: class I fructose-bisphosphate aldolase [Candidatus Magasanikbacteria bacterium]